MDGDRVSKLYNHTYQNQEGEREGVAVVVAPGGGAAARLLEVGGGSARGPRGRGSEREKRELERAQNRRIESKKGGPTTTEERDEGLNGRGKLGLG